MDTSLLLNVYVLLTENAIPYLMLAILLPKDASMSHGDIALSVHAKHRYFLTREAILDDLDRIHPGENFYHNCIHYTYQFFLVEYDGVYVLYKG